MGEEADPVGEGHGLRVQGLRPSPRPRLSSTVSPCLVQALRQQGAHPAGLALLPGKSTVRGPEGCGGPEGRGGPPDQVTGSSTATGWGSWVRPRGIREEAEAGASGAPGPVPCPARGANLRRSVASTGGRGALVWTGRAVIRGHRAVWAPRAGCPPRPKEAKGKVGGVSCSHREEFVQRP